MSKKLGDTVLLKEYTGKWEIYIIFSNEFDAKYNGKYAARPVPNTGCPENSLIPTIKLRDEHINFSGSMGL